MRQFEHKGKIYYECEIKWTITQSQYEELIKILTKHPYKGNIETCLEDVLMIGSYPHTDKQIEYYNLLTK